MSTENRSHLVGHQMNETNKRLLSLDILRGLDMLLLAVIVPLFRGVDGAWHLPEAVMYQFSHPWGGFTLYDIIMPLFIFMSGAAVPFALGKRLDAEGRPTAAFWKHVAWRFVMLWTLGMCVQGELLSFDIRSIRPYSNTLQTIATGYLVAALVMLVKRPWFRWAVPVAFTVAYGLLLAFGGDYSPTGNLSMVLDKKILGWMLPADSRVLASKSQYAWFLPSLMCATLAVAGMNATFILRSDRTPKAKALALFGFGAGSLAVGWALVPWVPMIKQIFTVSFTLQAIGWCVLALAALYVLTDICGFRRGLWLPLLFGQCALVAYLLHVPLFGNAVRALANMFVGGVPHLLGGTPQPFVKAVAEAAIIILALVIWRGFRTSGKKGV